ncbi:tandem-95 repeat protein [Bradyrhizobium cytisi]|uniref:Tandem-95 repeat protein n=2 Tax=Bradyrhizobium cytisi TaxID=515489 RepID=A0A5S4WBY8_9BRAD|nr:tandem-95 repeat protein [Bradyrhizobium cytisi]
MARIPNAIEFNFTNRIAGNKMAGPNDAQGEIVRISSAQDGTPANSDTYFSGFSPDGTKVLLASYATNLVPGLNLIHGSARFYVKDLTTGAVTLVSSPGGTDAASLDSDGSGSFGTNDSVIFSSSSDKLVPDDTNGVSDIFEKDLTTGAITRLSATASGVQANGLSSSGVLSPDGHRLLFSSFASNLVPGDTNNSLDVFIKDLGTGVITRVSTTSSGAQLNGGLSGSQIRWNANQLFFTSDATNASAGDNNGATDLFVKDLTTGSVSRISDAADGVQANGSIKAFSVSHDGTKVAFWSDASNLVAGDTNGVADLFVKDLKTGIITRVSTTSDGSQTDSGVFASQYAPSFSADDSKLAFMSLSGDLVPGDTNGGRDIFIKDLVTGAVTRVSTAADGSQGIYQNPDGNFTYPGGFSPDASMIAFSSEESGLVAGGNPTSLNEVFIKTLHPAPGTAADTYVASYSAPLKVDVAHGLLANDSVAAGESTLAVTSFSDAKHGRVDLNPDGSFTYTPDGTFIGTDSFTYKAGAGYQSSQDTTVTIKVTGNIERVDTQADGSQAYFGVFAGTPVLSSDGRYAAFVTNSSDLAPNPYAAAAQVVLKNLATGALTIVSGPEGGDSPVFSPDGTKVAFSSGDRNIIVDDLVSGTSTVVSTTPGGTVGVGFSYSPVFSPDGNSILFRSSSSDLTNNLAGDLFVKNLTTGTITRVLTAADGTPADGQLVGSLEPGYSFSPDGKWVVFASTADNLVAGDTNHGSDIFAKNLQTGQVIRVSTTADGAQAYGDSELPVFSPDGKSVAFQSDAENLVLGDTNKAPDIFIKNLETGAITRVSTGANGEQGTTTATAYYEYPVFSPDGTRIAFVSTDANLVPGVGNSKGDVYEKNLVTGAIRLVSDDSFGTDGSGWSTNPTYSADGTKISFVSYAANLVPGDTNGAGDVFIKDLTKFPYDPSHPVDVAPTLASISPADEATDVAAAADITLNFDKTVHAGHGTITITGDAGDVRTIDVTDANQVIFSGTTMTINPTGDLAGGQTYHVTFGAGVVVDAAGTAFAGLSSGTLDFTTAVPPPPETDGKVVDGYLSGATVFADANDDLLLSPGEVSTRTGADGAFTLVGGTGVLVATGGTDVSTGLPFGGLLLAPAGSSVLTPLTTLATLLSVGTVLTKLGLPTGFDLLHADPVAQAGAGNADAIAVLIAGAQVQDTVSLIAAALVGLGQDPSETAFNAIRAVAGQLSTQSAVDLTSVAQLTAMATAAGVSEAVADAVAHVAAATNTSLAHLSTSPTVLDDVAFVETAVQGSAVDAATQAGSDPVLLNAVVAAFADGVETGNGLPTAGGDHVTAQEHTPLVISAAALIANDTDPDGDTLSLVSVGHATHGDVVFDATNQTVTFTPDAGYSGAAAFDYTISDGHGGLATATVGVTVAIATPAAPTLTLAHDSGASGTDRVTNDATIAVAAVPGATLTYTVDGSVVASYDPAGLTQGVHHVSVTQTNAAGSVSAAGEIEFTYDTVAPDLAFAAPTGPTITDRPTEISGTAGLEDSGRTVQISEGGSVLGTAIVGSDGSWHADVTLHGVGDHTLVASATDLAGNTDQISTTLSAAANGVPTAGGDHVTAQEHTPLVTSAAALLANDTDPDGDTLSLVSVGHATHGNVVFDAAHDTVTFTPDAGYSGVAAFDYTVSDGHGGLATGTVGVTVKSGTTGGGWGDVHYTSFDGFKFNLQSTGDYVIAHATSGPEFEIEGRAENLGHTGVSYLTAVGVEAGDHLIVFDEAKPSTMLVDGHAVTFAVGDRLDLGDGVVIGRATATTHQIETSLDFVQMTDHGSYLDLSVHAGSARGPGSFEGLLGNLDGNARNDFGLANGSWLVNPSTKVIEGLFADAWRVGPQDNMLVSLGNETFAQRLSDATHDHASAISVHDWHMI